ncbi:HAD family hydrolase [Curtobacterium sp. MCLR17_036]|uniref:HAD family hydrolase n=1 Tax=Curtobacterium sp. MCLR17_036 TaxID=2175620 RepID=UPI000DA8DAD1|nr:HAD family hydrolase [Curtobacterium sp. MCLR17_036]WIE65687.1 HAD family hydrolase [Curtobacterium sp. MCLR17_036]
MPNEPLSGIRGVVFDVGETLVDETATWTRHALVAGVTPFTLMAALGALIARNEDHRGVWSLLGVDDPTVGRSAGTIMPTELYPDALPCLQALRDAGWIVGIAGNQPTGVEERLRDVGLAADFTASSAAWGVAKPDRRFFERVVDASGLDARALLYVGDRLDNDVLPARSVGMRTAFLRRGPWGHLHADRAETALADLRVDSLTDLVPLLVRA